MKKIYTLLFLLAFGITCSYAQLIINPSDSNPENLVNNFILSGVSASNIVYTGAPNALGSFSNGNTTNLGINNGIILTTGSILQVADSATYLASTSNKTLGCNDLTNIYLITTKDAAVLEFDLIPIGNILEFQYVFASEEYNEWVCSNFNDVFGFFLSGPEINGPYTNNAENIALIPDTSLPVAINSINKGIPGSNFQAHIGVNCVLTNSNLFIDNELMNGQFIVFDGFTTVLIAKKEVIPGETYHLKMAIADALDDLYDSGVFLKTKSMKSYNTITSVEEKKEFENMISPNPAIDKIEIILKEKSEIKILNLEGQILKKYISDKNNFSINISDITKGLYLISIHNNSGTIIKKLIKE